MNTTTQQIPTGYKQTEVGVIPEDWELVSYDQAFNFLKTASYSRAQLGTNGKIRYVHYGDIHMKWNFFVDLKQDLPTINEDKASGYSLLENGDVVMADASEDYGGIGKSVEVVNRDNIHAISGLHTFLLRDKGDYFVSGFRGYIHSNKYVKSSMDRLATGLKVYGVSKTNLKLVQIPRPPLPEQTAIANALSDTDELIENLEKLIAKKKAIKQGAMQELLTGKRRLPGFSGEWKEKKLKDFNFDISDGNYSSKYPKSSEFRNSGIPFIRANNIKRLTIINDDMRYISKELHSELLKGHLKRGDILITTRGEIGQIALVPDKHVGSNINAQIVRINTVNKLDRYYFTYFLLRKDIQESLYSLQTGSALKQLPVGKLESLLITYPNIEEQRVIGEFFFDLDMEIESFEKELVKYQQIKIGMMQQLLTGKIRLYGSN